MFRKHTHEVLQNQQKNPQYNTLNYEIHCIVKDHFIYWLNCYVPFCIHVSVTSHEYQYDSPLLQAP